MKKFFTLFVMVALTYSVFAQSPQKLSYQAVIRNNTNQLVTNHSVGMRVSILLGSESGTEVYQEIYNPNPQTNANGLITLEIGGGIKISVGTFSDIDWASGPYFIKVETDPTGGTDYTIVGTSQILSVPYALYAKTATSYTETDPIFGASAASGITGTNISDWSTAYGWGNHALAGYAPSTRTLAINGTTLDLTANRSWNVGTVTSVGLSLPNIFSLSGSPVTTTGTLTAALTSQAANLVFASPNASTGAPAFRSLINADIPNLDWSKITTGKPTTIAGYGITDAVNTTGNQTIAGNKTFSGKTTVQAPVSATDAATKAYVDAMGPSPGIAESFGNASYTLNTTAMTDLATITINIPSAGYIYVTGHTTLYLFGTTGNNWVFGQIDETAGGSYNVDDAVVGAYAFPDTQYYFWELTASKTYYKEAGEYTFRLECQQYSGTSGSATGTRGIITALFFPQWYGTSVFVSQ
jgi:hypothetical protein